MGEVDRPRHCDPARAVAASRLPLRQRRDPSIAATAATRARAATAHRVRTLDRVDPNPTRGRPLCEASEHGVLGVHWRLRRYLDHLPAADGVAQVRTRRSTENESPIVDVPLEVVGGPTAAPSPFTRTRPSIAATALTATRSHLYASDDREPSACFFLFPGIVGCRVAPHLRSRLNCQRISPRIGRFAPHWPAGDRRDRVHIIPARVVARGTPASMPSASFRRLVRPSARGRAPSRDPRRRSHDRGDSNCSVCDGPRCCTRADAGLEPVEHWWRGGSDAGGRMRSAVEPRRLERVVLYLRCGRLRQMCTA